MDGVTTAYGGIVGDAKLTLNPGSSIYIPESVSSSFAPFATREMDTVLLREVDAAAAFGNERAIEIVMNNVAAANAWEARMRALGIPGYVRLQP